MTAQTLVAKGAKASEPTGRKPAGKAAIGAAVLFGPFVAIQVLAQILGDQFPSWLATISEASALPIVDWLNSVVLFFRNEALLGVTGRDAIRAVTGLLDWPLGAKRGTVDHGL